MIYKAAKLLFQNLLLYIHPITCLSQSSYYSSTIFRWEKKNQVSGLYKYTPLAQVSSFFLPSAALLQENRTNFWFLLKFWASWTLTAVGKDFFNSKYQKTDSFTPLTCTKAIPFWLFFLPPIVTCSHPCWVIPLPLKVFTGLQKWLGEEVGKTKGLFRTTPFSAHVCVPGQPQWQVLSQRTVLGEKEEWRTTALKKYWKVLSASLNIPFLCFSVFTLTVYFLRPF